MIIDCMLLDDGTTLECDVVIIGAGMAGICLARQLNTQSISTIVIESGDRDSESRTDELNRGVASIVPPLGKPAFRVDDYVHESRERYFGGTGNVWGGKCGELKPLDFELRPWIEDSGWPISYEDLNPYYERACYEMCIPVLNNHRIHENRAFLRPHPHYDFVTSLRCFSRVTGKYTGEAYDRYKYSVEDIPNTRVLLNGNISALSLDDSGRHVSDLAVRVQNGKTHRVQTKTVILAAGGIENPRILLNSNALAKDGLGNDHDVVGRYFSGHSLFRHLDGEGHSPCIAVIEDDSFPAQSYCDKDPAVMQGILTLSKKTQWRERMGDFSVTFDRAEGFGKHEYPVFFMSEQVPNWNSRISLSDDRDSLGVRRVKMDWNFYEKDIENIEKGISLFDRFLRKNKFGRLSHTVISPDILKHAEWSRHHIGTTRMHNDRRKGVVDKDCKVHGVDNLYIAGTSVFPTGGLANPTLTVVALAIRLADNIKKNIG